MRRLSDCKLTLCACHSIGVSCVASPAGTVSPVVPGIAVGILGAFARVPALVISTSQMVGTVLMHKALVGRALHIGVPLVVWRTAAHSPVVPGLTDGVDSTGLVGTGVLALAVDAGLGVGTLKVTLTSGFTKKTNTRLTKLYN